MVLVADRFDCGLREDCIARGDFQLLDLSRTRKQNMESHSALHSVVTSHLGISRLNEQVLFYLAAHPDPLDLRLGRFLTRRLL
jgi:hypothetical protein